MFRRGRRLRTNSVIRNLVRENSLSVDDFIYPVFVVEGNNIKREISSLKGNYHWSVDKLDELVKDIDVQDVREKSLTDEKVNSIYLDVENGKSKVKKLVKILCYIILLIGVFVVAGFILHLLFPDIEWLWQRM